ncbi:CRISPR-associated endonuclease Cas2 [Furfurilactobacillus sp. WILCCON 0119]|uniref:CRISPR-associated endonuclease Cas2 n=1 Tax=Furfurilactobacillus entadae TaxID=2922307 RepID=UPI0035E825D6
MRLMVMFDLPMDSSEEKRNYRRFRKALINEGFLMMQYSVYVRVCVNRSSAQLMEKRIAMITPLAGLVQTLIVTEKQYQSMNFLVGTPKDDARNSAERTLII